MSQEKCGELNDTNLQIPHDLTTDFAEVAGDLPDHSP